MCGIGGVLWFPPERQEQAEAGAQRLLRGLRHRGPDGQGVYRDPGVILVHTRLALRDALGGAQPMTDVTGRYTVIFNGELGGVDALRARLSDGFVFQTRSDTEVLLAAFARWGPDLVAHLDGMYAFCAWDRRARRAVLARDPLGVKPLVVAHDGPALWFASEAGALARALPTPPGLDPLAVAEAPLVPPRSGAVRTPFAGIEVLPPGEVWVSEAHQTRVHRRWSLSFADEHAPDPDPAGIAAALDQAVGDALEADAPPGLFLSGGLDSSALAAAMVRRNTTLHAYTIRFEDHDQIRFDPSTIVGGDDAPWVDRLAQALDLHLHVVTATRADLVGALPALAASQDRIPAWEQELSQRALASAAAAQGKAVLVGDAADELFGGYHFALDEATSTGPLGLMRRFGLETRLRLVAPHLRGCTTTLHQCYSDTIGDPPWQTRAQRTQAMSLLIARLWLPRLLHNGDVHTMAYGLEARVPFAHRPVLAQAARVPPRGRYDDAHPVPEKRALRAAVGPWLPPGYAERRKSALPRDPRLGAAWQAALRPLLDEDARPLSEWLDLDAARRLAAQPTVTEEERAALYSLVGFAWFRRAWGSG